MTFYVASPDNRIPIPLSLKALFKGRRDGRLGLPPANATEFPPFEMRVKQKIDEAIRDQAVRWRRRDQPLHEAFCRLKAERTELKRRIARLHEAAARHGKEVEHAKGERAPFHRELRMGRKAYLLFILFLAIGEFPLNAIVFQILGEGTALTYLFSATIALVLPAAAHFLGMLLRRHPFSSAREEAGVEKALVVACTFLPLAVMGGVAYMREKFLEGSGAAQTLGVSIDPNTVTVVFIAFNALIFLVATTASWFAHQGGLEYAEDQLRRAERSAAECQRVLEKATKRIAEVTQQLAELHAKRTAVFEQFDQKARGIKDYMQIIIEVYREHNLTARAKVRKDTTRPAIWADYPPLNTNAQLPAKLDWGCSAFLQQPAAPDGHAALPVAAQDLPPELKALGLDEEPEPGESGRS